MHVKTHLLYITIIAILSVIIWTGYKTTDAHFISEAGNSLKRLAETNRQLEQRNSELDQHITELANYNQRLRNENARLNITIGRIQNYSEGASAGIEDALDFNRQLRILVESLPD